MIARRLYYASFFHVFIPSLASVIHYYTALHSIADLLTVSENLLWSWMQLWFFMILQVNYHTRLALRRLMQLFDAFVVNGESEWKTFLTFERFPSSYSLLCLGCRSPLAEKVEIMSMKALSFKDWSSVEWETSSGKERKSEGRDGCRRTWNSNFI